MHRVMIQPASYDNCAEAVDRAFERFPLEMAGAIKNSYGILPGAQKARLHGLAKSPERFHQVIVEVFRQRVPDLYIMDAVVGMEGNGPASPDLCTACGACIDHCPVSALEFRDSFPVVEDDTCITCFCCQEICPEKAISLK